MSRVTLGDAALTPGTRRCAVKLDYEHAEMAKASIARQGLLLTPEDRPGVARPEFTFRAVAIGLLIGCLLCFTNLYFGLQTGWISMMSLQSALLGYLISLLLPTPITPQENVVLQTTATATGTMPLAAGFVGILPALAVLDLEKDGSAPLVLTWSKTVLWSCAIAFFGVFLSPPIRKQVIIEEQLAFPSGTATAQLISVLHDVPPPGTTRAEDRLRHRRGYAALGTNDEGRSEEPAFDLVEEDVEEREDEREAVRREGWLALGQSFSASALMTLVAYFFPVNWLWSFTPSLSYVGQGVIMGFPTALSMNLGMIVGWAVLSPLSKYKGWAPGPVGDMTTGARGWILWTALAIMVADSVVSLFPIVREFITKSAKTLGKRDGGVRLPRTPLTPGFADVAQSVAELDDDEEMKDLEPPERLVPAKWVVSGLVLSIIIGALLVWAVFGKEGIRPWASVVGFLMGGVLSLLGVRALGETDLNPVSGLGKISQLLFAFIQPGNVVANIIAGGVAEAGAQQAGDLMQDLKTGHLLHASPRAQFYGQLIGSAVSIVVTSTAYSLYTRAYPIPGPTFPAPTAYVWLSLARLLRNGHLPPQSGTFMLAFAILFSMVSFLKIHSRTAVYARCIARLLGGVLELLYHRRLAARARAEGKDTTNTSDIRLIVVASGFVLGEGVVSVVSLILRTCGIGVASCWGCVPGMCAGCPAAA
ncbi:oligopeptide transporter [Phellopilus nigrolimitatus]|nr:oligopeptide transporter [Phellopilus nigrolimitatus]